MSLYRYQVNFEKVFTSGALMGRRYTNDYIRFTDWKSADAFAKSCDGKTEVQAYGGMNYIKECPILSALEPTNTAKEG